MTGKKKLPIGIESFEEIRKEGFYYVDKTGVIGQLLEKWGKVNLFTRPRRLDVYKRQGYGSTGWIDCFLSGSRQWEDGDYVGYGNYTGVFR